MFLIIIKSSYINKGLVLQVFAKPQQREFYYYEPETDQMILEHYPIEIQPNPFVMQLCPQDLR